MNKTKIRFSIVLMLTLSVLLLTGLSCSKQQTAVQETTTPTPTSTETTTAFDLSTVEPGTISTGFATNFASAKEKATAWKGDAKLMNLTIKLPKDLSLNSATLTFVFGSESDPDYWFTLTLSESSGKYVRALIPKTDYLGTAINTPVAEKYWLSNYLQAFQIAETYAGKTIRETYPNTEVVITLQAAEPKNWLWWLVEYKNTSATTRVRISPYDLTIVDDLGNVVSSSTSSSSSTTTTNTTPTTTGTDTTATETGTTTTSAQ